MTGTNTARRRALEERIAERARIQHGVVTRAQLVELGLGERAVDRLVWSRRLLRLHPGIYGLGPFLPTHAHQLAAVLACGPRALLSHFSSGILLGIVEGEPEEASIDVSVPATVNRRVRGVRLHRVTRLDADEAIVVDGIPTTSVVRTIADLAALVPESELERIIARAEKERRVSPEQLGTMRSRYARRPGAARLTRVLSRLGGPAMTRSEAEKRFLSLVRRAKLPVPSTNFRVGVYEVDFLWADHQFAVEIDGYRHHSTRASFEGDRRRNTQLAAMGIQVVCLTWRQIVDDELAVAVQIGQALARRG